MVQHEGTTLSSKDFLNPSQTQNGSNKLHDQPKLIRKNAIGQKTEKSNTVSVKFEIYCRLQSEVGSVFAIKVHKTPSVSYQAQVFQL